MTDIPDGINRFALVNVVRTRSNQMAAGASPRISSKYGEQIVSVAMRQAYCGVVDVPFSTDATKDADAE